MSEEIKEKLSWPFDAAWITRKKNRIRRQLLKEDQTWVDVRIAILGGSTTNNTQDAMELFLLAEGIRPSFYVSEYNKYWEDGMFDNAELEEFSPQVIYIHTSSRNISNWPEVGMSNQEIDDLLSDHYEHFHILWENLYKKYEGCVIIQNNFERPLYRLLGNQDICLRQGRSNFIYRLNGLLYQYAENNPSFFINDIDYLSSEYGLSKWHDPQSWNLYKNSCDLQADPELAYNVTRIIKALYGKNKKAISLDLDNTMWSGVVGDDGVAGLEMGEGNPVGEGYRSFQQYLKDNKKIGVLLAVNSKNDEENALEGLNHPDCLLKPDDFIVIKANWENKDQNIRAIADEINIGTDAFLFVDDNPAERGIIRSQMPEVIVPDFDNPDQMIRDLDRLAAFEVTTMTKDDLVRNQMYQANVSRKRQQQQYADYSEYLRSLEMHATIKDFEEAFLPRISQLTNKTNQFNLTTKRLSEAEITAIANDDNYVRRYARLEDKFGDNGIVSVVIGRREDDVLHLNLWLMSCRVLKRDLEFAVFDEIIEECKAKGIKKLVGYYYPTKKNKMVSDFYGVLGFEKTNEEEDGSTIWSYDTEDHKSRNKVIDNITR